MLYVNGWVKLLPQKHIIVLLIPTAFEFSSVETAIEVWFNGMLEYTTGIRILL